MSPEEWSQHDATALAGLIREGRLSAEEAREAALSAIERVNGSLRAVVLNMAEQARAQTPAEGPFRGVPMVVKDMDGFLRGVPCTYSTPFLREFVPDHDSALLGRLRSAGFVFVAKTNCPELGIMGTTEPQWRGPTHNPWDLGRSPGGSSGGSAALVAARAVPVGHGGDGGGSLRIPAAATGLVGHKCSRGLVPFGPDGGEGWGGYVSQGVLTRSMRDAAAIYDLLVGADEGAPYAAPGLPRSLLAETERDPGPLRVALCTRSLFGRETDPEHKAAAEDLGRLLVDLGHSVEEAAPEFDRPALVMAYLTQVAAGTSAEMADFERWTGRRPTSDSFEPPTWFLHQLGQLLSAAELQRARDEAQAAGRSLGRFFSRYDVLLTPTVAHPPVRLGELALKPAERFGLGLMRAVPVAAVMRKALADLADQSLEKTPNTQLYNMTGCPAISLPLAWGRSGLPIGLQLGAAFGRDGLLFSLGAQLERARPWSGRRPPVCA